MVKGWVRSLSVSLCLAAAAPAIAQAPAGAYNGQSAIQLVRQSTQLLDAYDLVREIQYAPMVQLNPQVVQNVSWAWDYYQRVIIPGSQRYGSQQRGPAPVDYVVSRLILQMRGDAMTISGITQRMKVYPQSSQDIARYWPNLERSYSQSIAGVYWYTAVIQAMYFQQGSRYQMPNELRNELQYRMQQLEGVAYQVRLLMDSMRGEQQQNIPQSQIYWPTYAPYRPSDAQQYSMPFPYYYNQNGRPAVEQPQPAQYGYTPQVAGPQERYDLDGWNNRWDLIDQGMTTGQQPVQATPAQQPAPVQAAPQQQTGPIGAAPIGPFPNNGAPGGDPVNSTPAYPQGAPQAAPQTGPQSAPQQVPQGSYAAPVQ